MTKALNPRNTASFCFRLALEIEHHRAGIFDLIRLRGVTDDRTKAFINANIALYKAHCALLDAQQTMQAVPTMKAELAGRAARPSIDFEKQIATLGVDSLLPDWKPQRKSAVLRKPCSDQSCVDFRNMNGGCDVCGDPCL